MNKNDKKFFIKLVAAMRRAFPTISVKTENLDDPCILLELDEWVYVSEGDVTVETNTLHKHLTEQKPGYIVSYAKIYPATRWAPQDCDIVDISEWQSLGKAVHAAYMHIYENILDQVEQYVGEDMYDDIPEADDLLINMELV